MDYQKEVNGLTSEISLMNRKISKYRKLVSLLEDRDIPIGHPQITDIKNQIEETIKRYSEYLKGRIEAKEYYEKRVAETSTEIKISDKDRRDLKVMQREKKKIRDAKKEVQRTQFFKVYE